MASDADVAQIGELAGAVVTRRLPRLKRLWQTGVFQDAVCRVNHNRILRHDELAMSDWAKPDFVRAFRLTNESEAGV
jgi:hypothetical protein